MDGVWVAAGAAILSFIGMIANVIVTVIGNRSTARKIEEYRSERAEQLENIAQRNRLQLAAIDKRLEAHQQAYTLWLKLHHTVKSPSDDSDDRRLEEMAKECWKWWSKNCLYFDPKVEEELYMATLNASEFCHKHFRESMSPEGRAEILKQIHHVPNIVRQAVGFSNLDGRSGHLGVAT